MGRSLLKTGEEEIPGRTGDSMSISSIDLVTLAPRSAEASGIVGREQHQIQHTGESVAGNFHKAVEQQSQRATETNKSEKKEYRFDDSRGSGGHGGSRGKKKKKQEEKEASAPRSTGGFDITI